MTNTFPTTAFYAPGAAYANNKNYTILRNPHIARNEEIQLEAYREKDNMRHHYLGHLVGDCCAAYLEKKRKKLHDPKDSPAMTAMLYECYNEHNPYDNEQIRTDFNALYQQMNGMPLREMDNIVYPVCKLCRDHEKAGFIEGIRLGVLLAQELAP